ncbi:MAG: IclR family transcriptional regulator domain-containing protein [Ramlibacter sp.]
MFLADHLEHLRYQLMDALIGGCRRSVDSGNRQAAVAVEASCLMGAAMLCSTPFQVGIRSGLAAAVRTDLKAICKPALARIADETEDTVFLMILSGDDSVCIERAEGSYPVKTFVVDVGTRRPLGVGAGSLAILSALPIQEAEQVLACNAGRVASYEALTGDRLRQMMLHAGADGHVAMDVVNLHGVRAIAVPVTTASGRAVAALSIAAVQ